MIIRTIKDVFNNSAAILAELDKTNGSNSSIDSFYEYSELGKPLVMDDHVATQFLEFVYRFNTHFIPNGLPGSGMCIGDFIERDNKTYITLHWGVMMSNLELLHFIRNSESLLRSWYENKSRIGRLVKAFLNGLKDDYRKLLEKGDFNYEKWNHVAVGLNHVEIPNQDFVDALANFSNIKGKKGDVHFRKMKKQARLLVKELSPYIEIRDVFKKGKEKVGHKGTVDIENGMFFLNSPAASGGASLHTQPVSNNLKSAIPGKSLMFIVGAQAGRIDVHHIGSGTVEGKHCVFLPPIGDYFSSVQKLVNNDKELAGKWEKLVEANEKNTFDWNELTTPKKSEVMKKMIPALIRDRVLGFQIDLMSKPKAGILSPIIAKSHLNKHRDFLRDVGQKVKKMKLVDCLLEFNTGYGKIK